MNSVRKHEVRPPAVADLFYPGDPAKLDREVERLITGSQTVDLIGDIKALVCPHAGYIYSGRVAGVGYKLLQNRRYTVVAIISPSHRERFRGVSVFTGKGYETPLGLVAVAQDLADALIEQSPDIYSSWAGHRAEHALEVQLPFLQKILSSPPIIPIVMGEQDYETCQLLGEALAKVLEGVPALIIASSDLSHYHPYIEAVAIDNYTSEFLAAYDEMGLMKALQSGKSEACGGGPIVAAMIASKKEGARQARVLFYENSGDVTGDHSTVVGYLSAAFGLLN